MTNTPAEGHGATSSPPREPPPLEIGEDNPSPFLAERVRVFFVTSLDLGFLLADEAGKAWIQHLRAIDDVPGYLRGRLAKVRESFKDEAFVIRLRMEQAREANAKDVWTEAFVVNYAPFIWQSGLRFEFQGRPIPLTADLGSVDTSLSGVRLTEVGIKLFPDGILCHTSWFDLDSGFSVARLVATLSKLHEESLKNFVEHAQAVLWSNPLRGILHDHDLRLVKENDFPVERDLKAKAQSHVLTFVEKFISPDGQPSRGQLLQSAAIPGLLNRTAWYDHYSKAYIETLASKEFGHRDDEIYVSHRDSTLVVFDRYWVETDPAGYYYMYDLLLGVQYLAARAASLNFALDYYQLNPEAKRLDQKDSDESLKMVLDGRSLVTRSRESLHFPLLVNPGFSRTFLGRIAAEMELDEAVAFIDGRVHNMSVAVDLKSAVEAAKEVNELETQSLTQQRVGTKLQGVGLWVAVAALILSAVLNLFALVYSISTQEPSPRCFKDSGGVIQAVPCPRPE